MEFRYLSEEFYKKYGHNEEILKKDGRPYSILLIEISSKKFAIPLRTHINKNNKDCFITKKYENSGLDFQKAVPILEDFFLNSEEYPVINGYEFNVLKFKENEIKQKFSSFLKSFLKEFKRHNEKPELPVSNRIKYSALQYFMEDIQIE